MTNANGYQFTTPGSNWEIVATERGVCTNPFYRSARFPRHLDDWNSPEDAVYDTYGDENRPALGEET